MGGKCAGGVSHEIRARRVDAEENAPHHCDNAYKNGRIVVRLIFQPALGLCIAAAALVPSAHAQSSAVYVVTYVEVMPDAVAPGAALLKQYRDASVKEDGNLRAAALQEVDRPNRFVIVEAWRDKAAFDAHGQSTSVTTFHDKLTPIADAPSDQRVNNALYAAPGKNESHSDAVYVVTHVDVIPPGKDDCMAALKAMSTDTGERSPAISATRRCSRPTAAIILPSSRRGPIARRSTATLWLRIRGPSATGSPRTPARYTTSGFTRR